MMNMSCFERLFERLEQKKSKSMDDYFRNENLKKSICKSEVMVCFITKRFLKDKRRREHCDVACRENKVMYAAVQKGVRLGKFKKYPWRKIEYFKTKEDLKKIMKTFYNDYIFIKTSGGA